MTTFTGSFLRSIPTTPHTGVQVEGSQTTITATGTASSVILVARVPNGATILDWTLYQTNGAGASQTLEMGTSNSPSALLAILSITGSGTFFHGMNLANGGVTLLPVRVSLSDDVEPRWVYIRLKFGVAISATADVRFQLWYTMDGYTTNRVIR